MFSLSYILLYNMFFFSFSFAALLLFSALLMELAARSAKGIDKDVTHLPEELSPIRSANLPHT